MAADRAEISGASTSSASHMAARCAGPWPEAVTTLR
jgi:hypothetical protein